jgi:prefoldin subunit 5
MNLIQIEKRIDEIEAELDEIEKQADTLKTELAELMESFERINNLIENKVR